MAWKFVSVGMTQELRLGNVTDKSMPWDPHLLTSRDMYQARVGCPMIATHGHWQQTLLLNKAPRIQHLLVFVFLKTHINSTALETCCHVAG